MRLKPCEYVQMHVAQDAFRLMKRPQLVDQLEASLATVT